MNLEGLRVGFALTGSFCTFSIVVPQMKKLVEQGAEVFPIVSESVDAFDTKFGTAESWKNQITEITGKPLINSIVKAEPIGPSSFIDVLIVAPCTGNTLGKLAGGITDTPVTMAVKAHLRNGKPVVLGISTNDGLGNSAKNIGQLLNTKNIYFVPFFQDDPVKKQNSLLMNVDLIPDTILKAMEGKQLEPVLWR